MDNTKRFKKEANSRTSRESVIVEKKPLGMSLELFWTIFSAIIGAVFFFGLYIGQAKFDKDKSDYYEEKNALKTQNNSLRLMIDSIEKKSKTELQSNLFTQGKLIAIKNESIDTWLINQLTILYKNKLDSLVKFEIQIGVKISPGEKLDLENGYANWDNTCFVYSLRMETEKIDRLWTDFYGNKMSNGVLMIK